VGVVERIVSNILGIKAENPFKMIASKLPIAITATNVGLRRIFFF